MSATVQLAKAVEAPQPKAAALYDPADHTAVDVIAHLDEVDEAEQDRILEAEKKGKNRKTIL